MPNKKFTFLEQTLDAISQLRHVHLALDKSESMKQALEQMLAAQQQQGGNAALMPANDEQFAQQIQMVHGIREEFGLLQTILDGMFSTELVAAADVLKCKMRLSELADGFEHLEQEFTTKFTEFSRQQKIVQKMEQQLDDAIMQCELVLADPLASLEHLQHGIDQSEAVGQEVADLLLQQQQQQVVPKNASFAGLQQRLTKLKSMSNRLAQELAQAMETKTTVESTAALLERISCNEEAIEEMGKIEEYSGEKIMDALKLLEVRICLCYNKK